jgi:hypothetical protein
MKPKDDEGVEITVKYNNNCFIEFADQVKMNLKYLKMNKVWISDGVIKVYDSF